MDFSKYMGASQGASGTMGMVYRIYLRALGLTMVGTSLGSGWWENLQTAGKIDLWQVAVWMVIKISKIQAEIDGFFLPFGKRLHSYGKSPFLMGKSTINGHFQLLR